MSPPTPRGHLFQSPASQLGCPSSSQQVKTLQKRRVQDLAQPHHLPLGPSRVGGPLWQTQTSLAALSLNLLTYKVGTARPPGGTLPRSPEIPHLRTPVRGAHSRSQEGVVSFLYYAMFNHVHLLCVWGGA